MGSYTQEIPKPWIETPCTHSIALSRLAGCNIYLKLENLQPATSFKSRGVGNLMLCALRRNEGRQIHYFCSSGGNAGLACATAAGVLGKPATIVVPTSTSASMVEKIRLAGAEVLVHGQDWFSADAFMRDELMGREGAIYVPPFDHPDVWAGNGTLVAELEQQMVQGYDGIVCSVGGGGLFIGIMQELERAGRLGAKGVKVLLTETEGADSLAYSLKAGKLSRLAGITSIATSLGATQVAQKAWDLAQKGVVSAVFTDAEAAMACTYFADDERILVEPACGVSLAPIYDGSIAARLWPELGAEERTRKNVVIVVCGGSKTSLTLLEEYRQTYGTDEGVIKNLKARGQAEKDVS